MKQFVKEHGISLLLLIFVGLLFILWGRFIYYHLQENSRTAGLTTLDSRLACLKSYGWEVDPGSETKQTIVVPEPLNEVYLAYNKLQKVSGFDLEKYQGEKAICYTYLALNFPYPTEEPVYINLLICDGVLIAGDCMSRALDGFMLPLDRRYLP